MHFNTDNKKTWLHKVNPSIKLFVFLTLCVLVLFIDTLRFMVHASIIVFILYWLFTGHSFRRLCILAVPFLIIFLSTSSTMILFGKGDNTWFRWGIIHITEEGFFNGLLIGFRALVFSSVGLVFALTTRPVFLFYSLMQQLKLKSKYAYSFMAGLRLIPIMIDEFQTIQNAMKVRGVENRKGLQNVFFKLKSYSIPLLSQGIRRAHRIAVAMEAKRFSDSSRTYYYEIGLTKIDMLFVAYFLVMVGSAYFLSF